MSTFFLQQATWFQIFVFKSSKYKTHWTADPEKSHSENLLKSHHQFSKPTQKEKIGKAYPLTVHSLAGKVSPPAAWS